MAADGNPLTTLRELEKYCMFRETVSVLLFCLVVLSSTHIPPHVALQIVFSVLRDAAVLEVSVTTGIVDGSGTTMDMVVRPVCVGPAALLDVTLVCD